MTTQTQAVTGLMRTEVDGDSAVQIIAMVGPRFVGHARMFRWEHPDESTRWILTDMWVAESDRRKGVGSSLIRAAVEWGEDAQIGQLWLWVLYTNVGAIALYQRFGFMSRGPWSEYPGYGLMVRNLILGSTR